MLPKLVQKCAIKGFTASLLRNISSFFLPFRVWLSENNCVILHQMKLYHHEKFIELKSSTALYENRGNWAQCRNGKVNWKIEFQALCRWHVIRRAIWYVSNFWIFEILRNIYFDFFQCTKLRHPTGQRQLLEND